MLLKLLLLAQTTPVNNPNCPVDGDAQSCNINLPVVAANQSTLQTALQIVFGVIAVVAVIYIVVAGLQFVTSEGDSQKVAKARQTILFAVIGLVIALLAETIVVFVLGEI